ncbi:MAG: membrane protein insertion efficiency factor YidD [Terracidiphilus sp.]
MTRILLALLAFYRRWLSPIVHSLGAGGCRYLPSCSEYAVIAISTHGPVRGAGLAIWRVLRCHPFTRGGLDPVPPAAPGSSPNGDRRFARTPEIPVAQPRPFPHEPLP